MIRMELNYRLGCRATKELAWHGGSGCGLPCICFLDEGINVFESLIWPTDHCVPSGSGGLSKWVNNGDNCGCLWITGVLNILTKSP